jgi:hypothetical protein
MSYCVQLKEVSIHKEKRKIKQKEKRKKGKLEPRRNRRKKRKTVIKRCTSTFRIANTMRVNHAASGHMLLHARSLVAYWLAFRIANTMRVNHAASGHMLLHARSLVAYCLAHVCNHDRRLIGGPVSMSKFVAKRCIVFSILRLRAVF